jgi:hypothetical protein
MFRQTARFFSATCLFVCSTVTANAFAIGESVAGFPNYNERVQHELANRARVAPDIEMAKCGAANCPDANCYMPKPPLYYKRELNHSARFHTSHMVKNNYFAHTSSCTLVPDINTLYPSQCDGSAACACVGGQNNCNPDCTSFSDRIGLFGSGAAGEIIASGGDAESAFYLWLYEGTTDSTCAFSQSNGHRWLILTADGAVGFGSDQLYCGDFADGGDMHPIASGAHWPRQADTVEAWANWYAPEGPGSALVNVDGTCVPMQVTRGTPENGAYKADISGVGTGCHRYFFLFKDKAGTIVTYPESGSLGIGADGTCADFSDERPATGAGCDCKPQCDGKQCGDDACGGSCGNCADGSSCDTNAQCVSDATADAACGCIVPGQDPASSQALGLSLAALVVGSAFSRRRSSRKNT